MTRCLKGAPLAVLAVFSPWSWAFGLHARAWPPRRSSSIRHRTARPAVPDAGAEAISAVAEEHRPEASRCWAGSPLPGLVAEMAGGEYRYDPRSQCHVRTGGPAARREQHPWRRAGGARAEAWGPSGGDYEHDGNLALELLKRDAPQGGIVADVGCGDAFMARHFVRSGRFDVVFALDVSWDVLSKARAAAEEENLVPEDGLFFLRCDAEELPFQQGRLDYVWWGQGMHLVADARSALASIFAALAPGGRLAATTMAVCFRGAELRRMAGEAGFTGITLERSAGRTIYTLTGVKP